MSELFGPLLARGPVAVAVGDEAWVAALLEVEAALAAAGAETGLVPSAAAARIVDTCRSLLVDAAELGRATTATGNPVVPLVRHLERAVGSEVGRHVHRGATSQDVMDTAMVLVARRALDLVAADLATAAAAAAALAERYRDTVMPGRTLLQQAVPTTFGLKAAGWLLGLEGAGERLRSVRDALPAQLGGAAGTLSAAGPDGPALADVFAAELGLTAPVLPWHTVRLPVADLAGALGAAAGVLAKVAVDVVLLAQSEVGEVWEGIHGRGGSSTMPHKRNAIAAVAARAAARRAPGLVATLLTSMEQEHERAAGAWHAEWLPLADLLRTVGSAAAWTADCLAGLQVDARRMRDNLVATGSAEAVAGALAADLGRSSAHVLVAAAVAAAREQGRDLAAVLLEQAQVAGRLSAQDLDALLRPDTGAAGVLVDRALAQARWAP